MRIERQVKCKMCKRKEARYWAYRYWHFVACHELFDLTENHTIGWTKTWWVCSKCNTEKPGLHQIDGFYYNLTWRPPFLVKS